MIGELQTWPTNRDAEFSSRHQGNVEEDKTTWQWTKEFLQMIGPKWLGGEKKRAFFEPKTRTLTRKIQHEFFLLAFTPGWLKKADCKVSMSYT